MRRATSQINAEYGDVIDLRVMPLYTIGEPRTAGTQLDLVEKADLVLVDIRGTNPLIADILAATRRGKATVASLLGGSFELMSLTHMGIFDANKFFNGQRAKNLKELSNISGETDFDEIDTMLKERLPSFIYRDIGAWFNVTRYWGINGIENVKRMLIMLAREYCKVRQLPKALPPLREPSPAIRHPRTEQVFDSLPGYLEAYGYDESKPTVVLVYYDGMHYDNSLVPTAALVDVLEPDINTISISCDGIKNLDALEKLGFLNGRFIGDAIVHLTWFRLNGGPLGGHADRTDEILRKIGVPVYHPVTVFNSSVEQWRKSKSGLLPVNYLANVVLPEIDGSIEPLLLCATQEGEDPACSEVVSIPDRTQRVARRIKRLLHLRRMQNAHKRLALIVYNYPPGEHNLGNAAYLDTFKSIEGILKRLQGEGYYIGEVPDDLSSLFLRHGIINSPQWCGASADTLIDEKEYGRLLCELPELKADIDAQWGAFPGTVNTSQGKLRIPHLQFGNICVALQPSRGMHEDQEKLYHDQSLAPHHQYAAFYRWLDVNMDAIVHVGTHGTLEFLRGKEAAVSDACDMDMLIGDLPHFYIYQTGNPSEAMIAKRRSLATTIGYAAPAADSAGLYGEYVTMRERLDELEDAKRLNPQRIPLIEEGIIGLAKDCGWDDLGGDLALIEMRLTAMQRSLIPIGLHVFGREMNENERMRMLTAIMRMDHGDMPSLSRVLAQQQGLSYDALLEQGSCDLVLIDAAAKDLIARWLFVNTEEGSEDEPVPKQGAIEAQRSYCRAVDETIRHDFELDALVNALSGGFTAAGLAADSLKNPEVFPTGRNLYQFNPLTLPTPSAVERGTIIARNTLEQYRNEFGEYPETVGVVLWGFETAKTCGETVGQVLDYLGVRVKTAAGSWFPGIEPLPVAEMTHPRIDVHIQICGFFRDMFPNLVALIDDAVRAVSKLDEPENKVSQKSTSLRAQLIEQGLDEQEASELSMARIFGPSEGSYGTSLTTMVETSAWSDEVAFGDVYSNEMCYLFGRSITGKKSAELNDLLLSSVDMLSQVQDTYEYDVTDLDHYYEFFGGFAKAVENKSGRKPMMLATNTAGESIRTTDIGIAITHGAVTRTFNPKWIDAMLEHTYHGAQKIADRVQYQIGLSATTGRVSQWVWEKTAQTFVFDEKMRDRLQENNPFATNEIARRLYEANRRGYWDATPEEIEQLLALLMELEENLEGEGEQ